MTWRMGFSAPTFCVAAGECRAVRLLLENLNRAQSTETDTVTELTLKIVPGFDHARVSALQCCPCERQNREAHCEAHCEGDFVRRSNFTRIAPNRHNGERKMNHLI